MVRTVVATAYGGPEVLEVIDQDIPPPGPGEVVVEMRAIGVNPLDYKLYTGEGAYSDLVLLAVDDVLPKPESMTWEGASCLLAAGTAAYEALAVTKVAEGDTVVVQGAAGGVGELTVQLAVSRGAIAIGVAWPVHHDFLRTLGAVPVRPGPDLAERIHEHAPNGIDAVMDTVGTDEVIDESLALGVDPERFVSLVAFGRAASARGKFVLLP